MTATDPQARAGGQTRSARWLGRTRTKDRGPVVGGLLCLADPQIIAVALMAAGLAWVAHRSHRNLTDAAFASSIAVMVFLLPAAGLVGPFLRSEISQTVHVTAVGVEARMKEKFQRNAEGLVGKAELLRRAFVYTTFAVLVAALALAQPTWQFRHYQVTQVLGSIAIALLVNTALCVYPITWELLQLRATRIMLNYVLRDSPAQTESGDGLPTSAAAAPGKTSGADTWLRRPVGNSSGEGTLDSWISPGVALSTDIWPRDRDKSMATNIDWPYADLGTAAAPNFTTPITDLLTKLHDVGKPDGETLQRSATPYSVQVITAGATSLSKGWAAAVGVLGGGSAIVAGIKGLVASKSDPALYRASFLFSAALLAAAVVIAIAVIVRSDVSARAEATAARAVARGQVVSAFLANYAKAATPVSKPCAPCGYLVESTAGIWQVVDQIKWRNGVVVVAGGAELQAAQIQTLVDVSSLVKSP